MGLIRACQVLLVPKTILLGPETSNIGYLDPLGHGPPPRILYMGGCQNYGPPFWVLAIIRHLVLRGLKGDHNFDNYPSAYDHPEADRTDTTWGI